MRTQDGASLEYIGNKRIDQRGEDAMTYSREPLLPNNATVTTFAALQPTNRLWEPTTLEPQIEHCKQVEQCCVISAFACTNESTFNKVSRSPHPAAALPSTTDYAIPDSPRTSASTKQLPIESVNKTQRAQKNHGFGSSSSRRAELWSKPDVGRGGDSHAARTRSLG